MLRSRSPKVRYKMPPHLTLNLMVCRLHRETSCFCHKTRNCFALFYYPNCKASLLPYRNIKCTRTKSKSVLFIYSHVILDYPKIIFTTFRKSNILLPLHTSYMSIFFRNN